MIGTDETRPLDWGAGRLARPIPAPRSRGLVFLARPTPDDEEAARLADALSRVAGEEAWRPDGPARLASPDGVGSADADPDGQLRVPALPIFPVEPGLVPPADAVREWLRTSAAGPYEGGPLLLMPIFPSARTWELPIDPYLDLGAELAQAGHAVHLLPIVAATRLGVPGDVNVGFTERDTDRLRFEGVVFVLGVRSAEAVDFDNLARETHLVAWQLAALPTAERARLLDDFGGEAVARARRLIHPTSSLRYVASCELAARSLDVALGVAESQDGAGSPEAEAAPAGISAAQAFAEGRRIVADAAASLTPDQVAAAVAERRRRVEIGLTGATTAPLTVAERAAALDGLARQVRETEADEAIDGLESAIRGVVDERATGLEQRLRASLGTILETGVNRWDPARALVRGAVVAGSEVRAPSTARSPGEGAGHGARARAGVTGAAGAEDPDGPHGLKSVAAQELAWPERPGEHLVRLGEAGASRPALATFTLLLMAGVFWATLGLGPLLSPTAPWMPIAGLLALLVAGAPLLVDRRAQDRLRRRYLAALRERVLAWTAALTTWGGTVYAPTRLRSATTAAADLFKQTWRAWTEARARAVHAAETARRTWFESASSHVASPLRVDELDQAVILLLQEADAGHCAERALRRLVEQPNGPDSGAGRDVLTLAPEAIWWAHRAEADEHLRPLAEATIRDFDEYIVSIWPRLEADLTTVARRLAGAGGREHVFVFVPDRLTLGVAAGPTRPHYVPAPDGEIGALVLARPRQALLELGSPEYPSEIIR